MLKAKETGPEKRAAPGQDTKNPVLVAHGINGTSITLCADSVSVTEVTDQTVKEIPIENLVALTYLKRFTPIGLTLTYIENGTHHKVTVVASPTKRPEFDVMERRIKRLMAIEAEKRHEKRRRVRAPTQG